MLRAGQSLTSRRCLGAFWAGHSGTPLQYWSASQPARWRETDMEVTETDRFYLLVILNSATSVEICYHDYTTQEQQALLYILFFAWMNLHDAGAERIVQTHWSSSDSFFHTTQKIMCTGSTVMADVFIYLIWLVCVCLPKLWDSSLSIQSSRSLSEHICVCLSCCYKQHACLYKLCLFGVCEGTLTTLTGSMNSGKVN